MNLNEARTRLAAVKRLVDDEAVSGKDHGKRIAIATWDAYFEQAVAHSEKVNGFKYIELTLFDMPMNRACSRLLGVSDEELKEAEALGKDIYKVAGYRE